MICWNISFECETPPCHDDYKEEDDDEEEESDDDKEVHDDDNDPNLPAMLAVILSTLWWNLYHCPIKENSPPKIFFLWYLLFSFWHQI